MKLLTIVVCYYPNAELERNVQSYAQISDELIIWDNTPRQSQLVSLKEVLGIKDDQIMSTGKNEGLAYPYNRAYEIALKTNCSHVMTMDQDSCFVNASEYRAYMEQKLDEGFNGMFVPKINSEICPNQFRFLSYAAQSGCVFPCAMLQQIGTFREDFFIGMVDAEIQLRAEQYGYKIMEISGVNLRHQVGSGRKIKFMGKIISPNDYGPLRNYYDSRNRILMWHEFPNDYNTIGKIKFLFGRIKQCLKILLVGDKKWLRISAIIRGTWNGLTNKTIPYKTLDMG